MTTAPERIWAWPDGLKPGWYNGGCTDDNEVCHSDEIEYTRTDLSNALIGAAYEAAAIAMGEYHWNRYAAREDGGKLHSPAVFTSHTHQTVESIIRALTPADARAALERVTQPRWYRMDDPENPPPPESSHIRGLWVFRAKTKERLYFQASLGHIHDETGEFVGEYDEDFGFAAEDYTHWTPLLAPPEDT